MTTTKLKARMEEKVEELTEISKTHKPVNSGYLALNTNALDILRTNLKTQPLSLNLFDIVKSPSGGSTVFSVPTLNGEDAEKELSGIILDFTTPRAYWDTTDPVEGTPPTCASQNSIVSYEGKPCSTCPFNTFGSKDGSSNAKACKESVLVFLLRPNSVLPLLVRVPVSSKNRFLRYSTRLLSTLTPINGVVTSITLEKAASKAGQPYALFNFYAVRKLSDPEAEAAQTYARQFMEAVNESQIITDLAEAS